MLDSVETRRSLLFGLGRARPSGPLPPGATRESIGLCSGCGECAAGCPQRIIRMDNGAPTVDFSLGECNFCGECGARCPEAVFVTAHAMRFDHVARIEDHCLALNSVDCQSCRDVCPEMAIRFVPARGKPFQPTLDAARCSGCGACLSVCPVQAIGLSHQQAEAQHG
ncbi:ferredoxin-type protein NapF [Rhizobium sp. KVB221]|uniref:Ferredoxin-type protein NapF n=1 Tax=Rhizobium setariae TaxID=2801340 RepID=A0A936YU58_9HYPH|nr:ferredoxin-type protein NapF [Rhizobium setariae]MBL0372942.1 ferredoxin-type protein NapF [Rhizobium setariae]